jgi:hypothetical protein
MPVDVPQGWPEIGLGLVLMALAVLIYFINQVASAFLGTGNRYKRRNASEPDSSSLWASACSSSGLFTCSDRTGRERCEVAASGCGHMSSCILSGRGNDS